MSARVRSITLTAPRRPGGAGRLAARATWLVPPLLLAASTAGAALVLDGPQRLFGWALAALFAAGALWIALSILLPGRVERRCPACGAQALERSDPGRTHGLRCRACDFEDETASAFLLAEEQGALEDIVLAERAERRRGRSQRQVGP